MARKPSIIDTVDSIIEQAQNIKRLLPAHVEKDGDDDANFDVLPQMDEALSYVLEFVTCSAHADDDCDDRCTDCGRCTKHSEVKA